MVTSLEEQLESLVHKAEERERLARRRAVVYSLVPILLAALLIGFTSYQIHQKRKALAEVSTQLKKSQSELASTQVSLAQAERQVVSLKTEAERHRRDAAELQNRVDELTKAVESITEHLREATNFRRYEFPGKIELSLKSIFSRYPQQSRVLEDIIGMQQEKVGWKLGGLSPQEGFDSPSFAAYVLAKNDLLPGSPSSLRYKLRDVLRPTNTPRVGDIVFYHSGYAMFYFEDERRQPFVIGMTPLGILALKKDFAPIVGYGAVSYRDR